MIVAVIPREVIFSIALPLGLAFVVTVISWRIGAVGCASRVTVALTPGIAFTIALASGWKIRPFPPGDSIGAVFYVACGVLLVGLIDSCLRLPGLTRVALGLLACAAAVYAVSGNARANEWEGRPGWMLLGFAPAGLFIAWLVTDAMIARSAGVATSIGLAAITGISAIVIGLSDNLSLGLQTATLPIMLLPAVVLAIFRPGFALPRAVGLVVIPLWGSMLLAANLYSTWRPVDLTLLAVSPLCMWAGQIGPAARLSPARRETLSIIATLIPLLAAAGLAGYRLIQAMSEKTPYDGY